VDHWFHNDFIFDWGKPLLLSDVDDLLGQLAGDSFKSKWGLLLLSEVEVDRFLSEVDDDWFW